MSETAARYIKPTRSTELFNATVARLTRMGISVRGSRGNEPDAAPFACIGRY